MKALSSELALSYNLTCTRCGRGVKVLFRAVSLQREEDGVCRSCGIILELPVIRAGVTAGIITKEQATAMVAAL